MKKAVVDLSGCQHADELHHRIQKALDFPSYYGGNLDAFWDCINRDCDADIVCITGISHIADSLKPTVKQIVALLEENQQYWADSDHPFYYEVID